MKVFRTWISMILFALAFTGHAEILQAAGTADYPYKPGEQLNFKIYFEFVLGGESRMSVEGIENINGIDCLRIVSEAKSTRTVDNFYKVRDKISTWIDLEDGYSRKFVKTLREGKHRDDKVVEYFPERNQISLIRKPDTAPELLSLDRPVHDVLAAFYEVRRHELIVGNSVLIEVQDIDKRYTLEVKVLRKERMKVPAGEFDCVVIEPLLKSAGIFRKEGSLQVWLTDDENHMPVLMQSQLYFGRVWAKLTKFNLGSEN